VIFPTLTGLEHLVRCEPSFDVNAHHDSLSKNRVAPWMVEYECFPELLAAAGQRRLARAGQSMAEKGGDLVTSARVSERTFAALADCLSRPVHETRGVVRPGERLGRRNMQAN
jgi:hypothetical protein